MIGSFELNFLTVVLALVVGALALTLGYCSHLRHQLRNEKDRFKTLIEAVPCTISWVDENLTYIAVNENLAKLLGLEPEQIVGKRIGFRGGNQDYLEFVKRLFHSPSDQLNYEFLVNTEQDPRTILSVAKKYSGGTAATIIGIDITEQKMAEKLIVDQQQALVAQEKLSVLGQVSAGIGHEIKNPLAAIIGLLDLLEFRVNSKKELPPEDILVNIEKMRKMTMRVNAIVDSLKSLSRNSENDPFVETSVKQIINEVREIYESKLRSAEIQFDDSAIPEHLKIACRESQIGQIFLNLIGNSIDALQDLDEKWIRIHAVCDQNQIVITFTDSGSGIPKDLADRILEPFVTTKPRGKGTGLGLSISKGIMEQHGGTLSINSECPNTQFILTFPVRTQMSTPLPT